MNGFVIPAFFAVPFFAAVIAAPAAAALQVCNRTAHPADVALGYYDGSAWSSSGWWTVEPGDCTKLIEDRLPARYYYLYAIDRSAGDGWGGEHSFCVGEARFAIQGRDCAAKGFEVKKFFQIDTGEYSDWTENLAE